jgi:hypothetical protein
LKSEVFRFLVGRNRQFTTLAVPAHPSGTTSQNVEKWGKQGNGKWTDQVCSRGKNPEHFDCLMNLFGFVFGALPYNWITLGTLLLGGIS